MSTIKVSYRFELAEGTTEVVDLELDTKTVELVGNVPADVPSWAKLDFHQCPHCPLSSATDPDCPLMANLAGIVGKFDRILSHDEVDLEVVLPERRVAGRTTAQRALGSLLGLVIATSGCPRTAFLKPMARYHVPLADEDETLYRASSMYLLAQYFMRQAGGETDFDLKGLESLYKDLRTVNAAIVQRLRESTSADSLINAVILLDLYARFMPYAIEDSLDEFKHLFTPYLEGSGKPPAD